MITFSRTKGLWAIAFILITINTLAQGPIRWAADGNSYFRIESGEVVRYALPANTKSVFISKADVTVPGESKSIPIRAFFLSANQQKVLIYTNSKRVWRIDSRGDYWTLDLQSKKLQKVGDRPASTT